jgi:peptide/nickel transport system substrate-binding protein
MPSVVSREFGLQTGELHMIEGVMEDTWVEKVRSFPNVKAKPYGPTEANMMHINMSIAPFNDIRVRKAVSYAITRERIAAFMGKNIAVPIYSSALAPPAIGSLTKKEAREAGVLFEDDKNKAKQLLAEAGYPNGFKTECYISEMASSYRKPMTAIQAELKKVGIDLELKVVDHASYHTLIRKNVNPFVLYSPWRTNVDAWLTRFYHSDSIIVTGKTPDTNFSHYGAIDSDGDGKIDSIDNLIETARSELDSEKQIALWKEAQIKVLRDAAVVPIMRLKYVFAMKSYIEPGHPAEWFWTTQAYQVTEKTRILEH